MRILLTSLATLISVISLYSQNQDIAYPHVTPLTPNAAELAKYADYPISYYTGTPLTNVPLYEINVDGLKLPITLNYHASGIRVDQEATWVGLGWSLGIGGRISRTVNSADDFNIAWDKSYPYILEGFYDAPDININMNNHYETVGESACIPEMPLATNIYNRLIYDPEPDIFYYDLPNLNGKFLIDKSRGAVLFNKSDNLKIEIIRIPTSREVTFKIIDKEGNQYLFNEWEITKTYSQIGWLNKNANSSNTVYDDNPSDYTEWTNIRFNCNSEWIASAQHPYPMRTSWCLNKIITKNGREINFFYDTETQYLPTQESCESYYYNGEGHLYYYKSKNVNTGLRLAYIEGDFGRIEFTSSQRSDIKGDSKKLDSISIYNIKNNLIKSFRFNYSYFNSDYSGNILYEHVFKRLKLDGVVEYSGSENPLPLNNGHVFDYSSGAFPAKNSKNVDYWGFQNGKNYGANYYIGLQLPNNTNYGGVKKDMNFEKAIIGTLKTVKYPTGGIAEFKFESNTIASGYFETHTYEAPSSQNSTMTDLPVYNNFSVYPYEDLYPSTDSYTFEVSGQSTFKITGNLENSTGEADPTYTYNNANAMPLGKLIKISPASQTYYTYACPYVFDSGVQAQGSEVILSNQEFVLDAGTYKFIAYMPPRNVLAYWRLYLTPSSSTPPGTPLTSYNAGGIRISEIKTDATTRKFNYPIGNMSVEPVLYYLGRRDGIPAYIGNCIVQVSESKAPLSTFNNGNFLGYDWVEEYVTDESGDISKIKYSFFNETQSDFFDDNFPDSPRYLNYTNGLIHSVEKYKNTTLTQKNEFTYTSSFGNYINVFRDRGQFKLDSDILQYYYRIEWPLKTRQITSERMDNGENMLIETNYSYNSKNLIQSTSVNVNNAVITKSMKYPFDLGDSISLSMVVKNIIGIPVKTETFRDDVKLSTQEISYDSFYGNLLPKITKTSKSIAETEDRMKCNYYDSKGNLLEVEKPGGLKISYIWGYNNTQLVAELKNIAYAEIPTDLITNIQNLTSSSNAVEADILTALNALRISTNSNLKQAMITTYSYKPLVGVTSITDAKGETNYYEYDDFGRLTKVKNNYGKIISENSYNYRSN